MSARSSATALAAAQVAAAARPAAASRGTLRALPAAVLLGCAVAGCASGVGNGGDSGRRDGGPADASPDGAADAGDGQVGPDPDGGGLCGGELCDLFERCVGGRCVAYPPCAGNGACPNPDDICVERRCVPAGGDLDRDGSPTADDCDDTDAERYPGATEICNLVDDDCDEQVDDGDPAALCAFYPGGGICIAGSCGCPAGTFDLDRDAPGCECVAAPAIDQGRTCADAIQLGNFSDAGQMITVAGNVMPDDREVWYRFRAVDVADTSCDNLHVRARFVENPSDTFEMTVFRGTCTTATCDTEGYTDFRWATDLRATIGGRLTGQCPCFAPGATPIDNVSACADDSANYFVRVRRRAGAALHCESYSLEISNGVYDS